MKQTIFKSIRVINPATNYDQISDVFIKNSKIISIKKNIDVNVVNKDNDFVVYDCTGLIMAPGIVDMRVNLGKSENIRLVQEIAVQHGITSMVVLPNQTPRLDNPSIIDHLYRQSQNDLLPEIRAYGAATKGVNGLEMTEMGLMSEIGAIGFTNGNISIKNSLVMRRVMSYAAMINQPVIQHAEDEDLSGLNEASTTSIRGEMNEGEISTRLGLIGIPSCAEVIIVERDIRLAELTGVHYHVAHVSTKEAVDVIRHAKKRGLKITCDTAPPYFCLNETVLSSYNTAFKLSPPLRTEDDRLAIIEAIKDGTIDAIASDHRSRSKDTKIQPFSAASVGATGIETLFLLTLELVQKNIISLNKAISMITINPAKLLKLKKPELQEDKDATFFIFKDKIIDKIKQKEFKNIPTPFDGRAVTFKVLGTFIKGNCSYIHELLHEKLIK